MPETKTQPAMSLSWESLTFTRSDGKETTIALIDDLLENPAADPALGGIAWALLMKLQGVLEFQSVIAEQQKAIADAQVQTAEALRALVQRANDASQQVDTKAMVRDALSQFGMSPEMLQKMMSGMGQSTPGVDVTRPNGGAKE